MTLKALDVTRNLYFEPRIIFEKVSVPLVFMI